MESVGPACRIHELVKANIQSTSNKTTTTMDGSAQQQCFAFEHQSRILWGSSTNLFCTAAVLF